MSDQNQLLPLNRCHQKQPRPSAQRSLSRLGYCSEANLAALATRQISAYLATGRTRHPTQAKRNITGPLKQTMGLKPKRAGRRSRYRAHADRRAGVRTVTQARGFRQFLWRGIENVKAEWAILCIAQPHQTR